MTAAAQYTSAICAHQDVLKEICRRHAVALELLPEMRGYISADRYFADIRSFLRIRIGYGYRFDGRRFFAKLKMTGHTRDITKLGKP